MDKLRLDGQIKCILRERTDDGTLGEIIRETLWVSNTVTDIWRMRTLLLGKMVGAPALALRSASRDLTGTYAGQYAAAIGTGNYGLYLTNSSINVSRSTIIPPYVTDSHNQLNSNVVFRNVSNALGSNPVEDASTPIALDNRSRYSYLASDSHFEVRYVKNTGTGTVAGICFGRDFADPAAHTGVLLGEYAPTTSTVGTSHYFLEHREDRTIVWKTRDEAQQFSFDLRTKQMTQYTNAALNTNISALTGGLVIGGANGIVVKAELERSEVGNVGVKLTGIVNFTFSTDQTTTTVSFPGTNLNTTRAVSPILVARPDIQAFEVFVPMLLQNGLVQIQKATITNFQAGLNSATIVTSTVVGETPYVLGARDTADVDNYLTGYYDVALQRYYFPYRQHVTAINGLTNVATDTYSPGIILSADLQTDYGHYLAKTDTNFNAPCMTDAGVLYCRANTTTMHYFQGTGVISGANFDTPIVKEANTALEFCYRYSLT